MKGLVIKHQISTHTASLRRGDDLGGVDGEQLGQGAEEGKACACPVTGRALPWDWSDSKSDKDWVC